MPANITNNEVTVTNAATQLLPQNPGRTSALIENTSSTPIYVGTQNVTASTGFPLTQNQTIKMTNPSSIWAITAAGSATAAVLEESN
jgi:hypothetical protein